MIRESPKSTNPRKMAIIMTRMSTTVVDAMVSFLVGHTTFLSSICTSFRNCTTFSNIYRSFLSELKKMAGQEGFEPPSPGFGIRCSSRWSYWPNLPLFRFFMERVDMAESAVFLKLQFLGRCTLILSRRIISSLALSAFKCNNIAHELSSLSYVIIVICITPTLQRQRLPLLFFRLPVSQTATPSPGLSA